MAAEKPCAEALTLVGKTSAAMRNETEFGPNWLKTMRWVCQLDSRAL